MKFFQMNRIVLIFTIAVAAFACCSSELKADWVEVQKYPIRIYRDTRTGLEWSVTITNAGNSNANAQNIVQQYGLRLPTWDEFRDVVNNNNAINRLEMENGLLDLYETDDPDVLVGVFGGRVQTKRPRQKFTRTWVIGVR